MSPRYVDQERVERAVKLHTDRMKRRMADFHCPECGNYDPTEMTHGRFPMQCLECRADVIDACGIECEHLWEESDHPDLDAIEAECAPIVALFTESPASGQTGDQQ